MSPVAAGPHGAEPLRVPCCPPQTGHRRHGGPPVSGVWVGLHQSGRGPGALHSEDGQGAHCVHGKVQRQPVFQREHHSQHDLRRLPERGQGRLQGTAPDRVHTVGGVNEADIGNFF